MSASPQQECISDAPPGVINSGNPVFTCTPVPAVRAPSVPGARPQHPLYRTTSSQYGVRPPTAEYSPCSYHPRSQRFTEPLAKSGMYRDRSLNTTTDRSRVYDHVNLQNTL